MILGTTERFYAMTCLKMLEGKMGKNLLGVVNKGLKFAGILGGGIVLLGIVFTLVLHSFPSVAADGADKLRKIIGERPVAEIEMAAFKVEDMIASLEYHTGLSKPGNPFSESASNSQPMNSGLDNPASSLPKPDPTRQLKPNQSVPEKASAFGSDANIALQGSLSKDWRPDNLASSNEGAGKVSDWQPYLNNPAGKIIAYRSFTNPDPSRPYAYAAIVAFDLQKIKLHYITGFDEPYTQGVKKTSGTIPRTDRVPGQLLAAFNGGFKFEHGHFGSMANGVTTAPAISGLGTLAIFQDGSIKIGTWGKDILPTPALVSFRQNGPLLIEQGKVNPLVDDPSVWGFIAKGATITWRSGIGIGADGRTLYYFAGPFLSIQALANSMEAAHVQNGMELDINNYWVLFSAFNVRNGQIVASPLTSKGMNENTDRYLMAYARDFFYVTNK
jgi:hypothetical protein